MFEEGGNSGLELFRKATWRRWNLNGPVKEGDDWAGGEEVPNQD